MRNPTLRTLSLLVAYGGWATTVVWSFVGDSGVDARLDVIMSLIWLVILLQLTSKST